MQIGNGDAIVAVDLYFHLKAYPESLSTDFWLYLFPKGR